jgi:hypothetical protein
MSISLFFLPVITSFVVPSSSISHRSTIMKKNIIIHQWYSSSVSFLQSTATQQDYDTNTIVGPRLEINEEFPSLQKIYSNPDIFVIENFLNDDDCEDLINKALGKKLDRSPVAYAGWTTDFKDLVELAAKGPVAWCALIGAWLQVKDSSTNQIDLVMHALQNYAIIFVIVTATIAGFTFSRAEGLKGLRTSTSTTLDDLSYIGPQRFVQQAAKLFSTDGNLQQEAALFEAPTVIRYEPGQVLAPHYDANRSAETEDANRGGQTLATLLVYLNDVNKGGLTRFGKLSSSLSSSSNAGTTNDGDDKLVIQPKKGDALLFFPADRLGNFDPRTEHEGMPAVDEKWIARIWRHKQRVPPPFGLSESALDKV